MVFDSGYSELPRNITPKVNLPNIPDPSAIIDLSSASDVITRHPLCDENLLKDIDGLASIASMPSTPQLDQILSASGLSDISKKLDPKAMFSGVPEFTGLISMPGIPDKIDFKKEAKALASDVLKKLDIDNPLSELCGQIQGFGGDAQDELGKINIIPDINSNMPNIDTPNIIDELF